GGERERDCRWGRGRLGHHGLLETQLGSREQSKPSAGVPGGSIGLRGPGDSLRTQRAVGQRREAFGAFYPSTSQTTTLYRRAGAPRREGQGVVPLPPAAQVDHASTRCRVVLVFSFA